MATEPVQQVNTAYQHRPLSTILAPAADPAPEPKSEPTPGEVVKPVDDPLPEKYQGKTVAEVADMHMNAESELGRVRNEVGTYRGLVNDLSALQRTAPESKPIEREPLDVSGDDLITNPVETVRKIVQQNFDELAETRTRDAEENLFRTEGAALVQAYPNIAETINTPEFHDFVSRTPSRQADYQAASAVNTGVIQVRAARRLLEDFTDFQAQAPSESLDPAQAVTPTPTELAKKAATEGSGPSGPISTKPLIYETDVIELIKTNRPKYVSPSFQTELLTAIKEGRYVKQT